jgi:antitoxin VapB
MSLNIKNAETFRLAHELAELTGESVTGAVTASVRERLERIRQVEEGGVAERLLEIGRDVAARLPADLRSVDHADLLYDETGLPR